MTRLASLLGLALLFATSVLVAPPQARAETALLVVDSSRGPELLAALEQALSGQNARFRLLAPEAEASEAPAEMRTLASLVHASTVVWRAGERLRALNAETGQLAEAPLPADLAHIEPRTFAVVAGSLVSEVQRTPLGPSAGAEGASSSTAPAAPSLRTKVEVEAVPGEAKANDSRLGANERRIGSAQPVEARGFAGPRFFVRAGGTLGFALLREGNTADRGPSSVRLRQIASASGNPPDLAEVRAMLRDGGYHCDPTLSGDGGLSVGDCEVALTQAGYASSLAVDLALGVDLLPRLALALTARLARDAGFGTLAHAVLGVQGELSLTRPSELGAWAKLGAGFGLGQIQARPAGSYGGAPYVRSGPGSVRLGAIAGYRFAPRLGMFMGVFVHRFFPDPLWAIDPSLGLELRL